MKKIILTLALVVAFTVNVWATPVDFLTNPSRSSVIVTQDNSQYAMLIGTLALVDASFSLADGATQELDFFTLTADGLGALLKSYTVVANIAFLDPSIGSEGAGGGTNGTSVPEPATMLLFGLGLVGLAGVRRKLKK